MDGPWWYSFLTNINENRSNVKEKQAKKCHYMSVVFRTDLVFRVIYISPKCPLHDRLNRYKVCFLVTSEDLPSDTERKPVVLCIMQLACASDVTEW